MSDALWNMAYAHLQAENATLKAKVESLEAKLRALEGAARAETALMDLFGGCGNHGCVVGEPRGMATNGPCRCAKRIREVREHIEGAKL